MGFMVAEAVVKENITLKMRAYPIPLCTTCISLRVSITVMIAVQKLLLVAGAKSKKESQGT